jgi:mannose-6-phosphate isomerase-like protein (cupin superfamily)
VVVPPNVVHSFRNEGPGTARFLVVHAPSCGFDDYLRALRDGRRSAAARFDQHDPPPDGGRPASDALIQPGAAAIDMVSLAETDVSQDERENAAATSYWVLDGTLTVRAGDEELEAERDDFVLVPPGTAHTLAGPARVVTIAA